MNERAPSTRSGVVLAAVASGLLGDLHPRSACGWGGSGRERAASESRWSSAPVLEHPLGGSRAAAATCSIPAVLGRRHRRRARVLGGAVVDGDRGDATAADPRLRRDDEPRAGRGGAVGAGRPRRTAVGARRRLDRDRLRRERRCAPSAHATRRRPSMRNALVVASPSHRAGCCCGGTASGCCPSGPRLLHGPGRARAPCRDGRLGTGTPSYARLGARTCTRCASRSAGAARS